MASPRSSHPWLNWLPFYLLPSTASSFSAREDIMSSPFSVRGFRLAWSCLAAWLLCMQSEQLCVCVCNGPVISGKYCFVVDLYSTNYVLGLSWVYNLIETISWLYIYYKVLFRPFNNWFIASPSSWVLLKDSSSLYLKSHCELSNCPYKPGHWASSQACDGPSAVLSISQWTTYPGESFRFNQETSISLDRIVRLDPQNLCLSDQQIIKIKLWNVDKEMYWGHFQCILKELRSRKC